MGAGRIREPDFRELKILKKALGFFRSEKFLDNYDFLIITRKKKKEVYMVPRMVREFMDSYNLNPFTLGVKIGELGRRLRITLEGGEILSKRYDGKRVLVNEKGEMLFLYGRDLFGESVIECSDDIKENDIVFVYSRSGYLGLGRARVDHTRIKENRVVVNNLVDKGEYLRKIRIFDAF